MGREATVLCQWASETAICKVLLESHELIVRGGMRRRVPLSQLSDVSVENKDLRFRIGEDHVSLRLGPLLAERWAKALLTPPPSLAMKLGISRASRLLLTGDLESDELRAAVAEGSLADTMKADLAVVSVKDLQHLELALDGILPRRFSTPPIWIVYPKKSATGFGEQSVRACLCARGFIDTKVASISAELTALRFIRRRH